MSRSIYINHTQRVIYFGGNVSVFIALARFGWDTCDDVECQNLYVIEESLDAHEIISKMIVELVKTKEYSISGEAAARLAEGTGLGDCYDEDDFNTYVYDTDAQSMFCVDLCIHVPMKPEQSEESESAISSPSSSSSLSSYADSSEHTSDTEK